jgi:hypothetical protein
MIYGTSAAIGPVPAGFVAAADFYNFAPMPYCCCEFLVSDA